MSFLISPLAVFAQETPAESPVAVAEPSEVPSESIPVYLFASENGDVVGIVPIAENLAVGCVSRVATSTEVENLQETPPDPTCFLWDLDSGSTTPVTESGAGEGQRKFIGQYYDEYTELSYLNARYYDGARGQFTSQDPSFLDIGASGFEQKYERTLQQHLMNPQALNSYSYALNNPITLSDPEGEIVPLLIAAYAAFEIGLSAYDAYTTAETLSNPNASFGEKATSVLLFGLGVAGPGAGYAQAPKVVDKTLDSTKVLRGTQNPVTKEAASAGREAHRLYDPGRLDGNTYILNRQIPGTKLRPDALDLNNRTIRELKPENSQAIQRGQQQLQKYIDAANKAYPGKSSFKGTVDTYKKK